MKKTIAVFDLDSTITYKDTYVPFLLSVLKTYPLRVMRTAGLPFAVILYKIKLKDNSWLKETFLNAIMGGLKRQQVLCCRDKFLDSLLQYGIHKDALQTITMHRQAKHQLVMATASFDFYTQELGQRLGFDEVICTRAGWDGEQLSGKMDGNNCYGLDKLERLSKSFQPRGDYEIIAYSDHHSDAPFLQWANKAFAINPTAKLRKITDQHNFIVQNWM